MTQRFGFCQFVRSTRLHREMQQAEMANMLGISAQYLADIELGRRAAPNDIRMLNDWADALNVPASSLYQLALLSREPALSVAFGLDDMSPGEEQPA